KQAHKICIMLANCLNRPTLFLLVVEVLQISSALVPALVTHQQIQQQVFSMVKTFLLWVNVAVCFLLAELKHFVCVAALVTSTWPFNKVSISASQPSLHLMSVLNSL